MPGHVDALLNVCKKAGKDLSVQFEQKFGFYFSQFQVFVLS